MAQAGPFLLMPYQSMFSPAISIPPYVPPYRKLSVETVSYFHVSGPAKEVIPILTWIEDQLPSSYFIENVVSDPPNMSFNVGFDSEENKTKFYLFWRTDK